MSSFTINEKDKPHTIKIDKKLINDAKEDGQD